MLFIKNQIILCLSRVGERLWFWHDLHQERSYERTTGGHRGLKTSGIQRLPDQGQPLKHFTEIMYCMCVFLTACVLDEKLKWDPQRIQQH